MADAPKTDEIEQKIGYIGRRLREKSTYGGLAVLVGFALPFLTKYFPNLSGTSVATVVDAVSSIGIGVGTLICVFLPEKTVKVTNVVVKILLVAFALSFFLVGSSAQAQIRKPQITGDLIGDTKANLGIGQTTPSGVKLTGDAGFDFLKMLDAKLLPDLQYAKGLADANGNKLTSGCWQAWIDLITTNENAVKNQDGTAKDPPDPHLITTLERAIDIRNALQPQAPFMVACSPVANLIKTDVVNFIGKVVAGGVSLTTLVPLL